jgi:hypothetical protein
MVFKSDEEDTGMMVKFPQISPKASKLNEVQ